MSSIQIPKNWTLKKISEITDSYAGGTPDTSIPKYWENGTIQWIRSGELRDRIIDKVKTFITNEGLANSSAKLYPSDTVLIAITGATTGKTALLKTQACGTQNVFGILPCNEIIPEYVWYYMRYYYRQLINKSIGGAQPHVNGTIIKNTEILYPKNKEIQKRIVKKLDYILGCLEEKKKEITNLQNNYINDLPTIMFQKMLKMAFAGNLTNSIPIKQNANEIIKEVKNEKVRLKIKSTKSESIDQNVMEGLPQLPKHWSWVTLDNVCLLITDGSHQTPPRLESGYPMLSAKNIRDGFLDLENIQYVSKEDFENELKRCKPQRNDLLMVSVGATIGRASLVNTDRSFMLVRSVALIRPSSFLLPHYLFLCIKSEQIQKILLSKRSTSAQPGLYLSKIKNTPIPLPPIEHQKAISEKFAELQNQLNHLRNTIHDAQQIKKRCLSNIDNLSKTVLEQAFLGKLII